MRMDRRCGLSLLTLVLPSLLNAQTPVIVISIDTLRADRLGARTPNLNAFAGTTFTQAESQIPLTLPSHTTLFTSTYPFESKVEENAGKVPPRVPTLATVLKERGYRTAAFIGSIFLERQLGLDRGFDTYDSPFDFEAFSRLSGEMLFAGKTGTAYTVRERRPGALVIRAANQWLAAHKTEPVFLFVHLFDMHKPWREPTYEKQLESVDQLLGGFRRTLEREGWWDRSLVVVLSDHGEGLGDHGESDHGYFIYESTLHVPLIVHWPKGSEPMPAREDKPVGLIDVAPSVLDFLKIPKPATFKGRSFLDGTARTVFSESVYARDSFGWSALRSLRDGRWKYIEAPRPELYNIAADPGEHTNVIRGNQGEATRLRAALTKYAPAPAQSTGPVNKDVLESMGYLAPGPQSANRTPPADPKDRLPELLRYEDALTLLQQRSVPAAIAVFRSIVASDPRNLLARRDLGVALIEQKHFAEARQELQRVAGTSAPDYVTLYELGIANEALGDLRQALARFEAASEAAPGAAQAKDAIDRVRRKL